MNPFYTAMNNQSMMQSFQQFMMQMKGRNPREIIEQMVASGRITQEQLDAAQKQAQQMQGDFESMRGIFGM